MVVLIGGPLQKNFTSSLGSRSTTRRERVSGILFISPDPFRKRVERVGYPTATWLGSPVEDGIKQAATAPTKQTHFPHVCPE
jgi:hypothetical protein